MNKQDEEKIREILNCERCKKIIALAGVKCNSPCDRFKDLMKMADLKQEQMIEKAASWLKQNVKAFSSPSDDFLLGSFKKAMEERP